MVDPKNGSTDKNLFFKKERDMDIINLVKKVCKTGDVFVDVGANIGYETIYASHIVGESGLVYSFEPLKNLASQIMESIQINKIKNITLINKALSDQAGKAFIYLNDEDAGLTSLETKDLANKKTEITLSTMDEELKNIKKRVSFIKVDVEGHELEVLKGAKSIIEKNNPYIVFEFNPHIYEKKLKGSSLELLTFLNNFGYQIKEIDYDKIISPENFMKFIKTILDDERMPNLVAVPK